MILKLIKKILSTLPTIMCTILILIWLMDYELMSIECFYIMSLLFSIFIIFLKIFIKDNENIIKSENNKDNRNLSYNSWSLCEYTEIRNRLRKLSLVLPTKRIAFNIDNKFLIYKSDKYGNCYLKYKGRSITNNYIRCEKIGTPSEFIILHKNKDMGMTIMLWNSISTQVVKQLLSTIEKSHNEVRNEINKYVYKDIQYIIESYLNFGFDGIIL